MPAFQGSGGLSADSVESSHIVDGEIVNADVSATAGIAYSKLSLTGEILDADLAGSIANTKLATNPLTRSNHTGTQTANTISDLATVVKAYTLDEFANPTADIDINSNNITNTKYQDYSRMSAPANPSANYGRVYVKQIDANNDGLFMKVKKAGSFVEVQIA